MSDTDDELVIEFALYVVVNSVFKKQWMRKFFDCGLVKFVVKIIFDVVEPIY